ncbi:AbiH family protein [Lactiplantibacillus plantarum]|uniref:AbiH family protein n=1 Tax=Lactiplantibacillus plantarum TaxID=1590 RepID=UPI001AAF7EDD|nr:AbiH family protein [Lactiplantibacillus plantarum]MBO2705791.1 hypothetical protein [Lactiplantibacillus plantarum]MDN7038275.1 hypothetical protein [Lactiplantibacillus plantarum]MDO7795365.1 AbiH family protein [Lactiplantibacillus plantarum]
MKSTSEVAEFTRATTHELSDYLSETTSTTWVQEALNKLSIFDEFKLNVLDIIFFYSEILAEISDVPKYLKRPNINWSDIESVIGICSLTLDAYDTDIPRSDPKLVQFRYTFKLICDLIDLLYTAPNGRRSKIQELANVNPTVADLQEKLSKAVTYIEESFADFLRKKLSDQSQEYPKPDHIAQINKYLLDDPGNTTILNFNYTDLPLFINNKIDFIHPHGSLSSGKIIFGINSTIDDKLIDGSTASFQLTKTFRGLLNRTLRKASQKVALPADVQELVFFGHSLNTSDYDYFYSLFDKYNLYNSDLQLTFYYALFGEANPDNFPKKSRPIFNKQADRQVQNTQVLPVTKLIDSYGESIKTSEHGNNLLHRLLLEDRIQIVDIEPDSRALYPAINKPRKNIKIAENDLSKTN